MIQLVITFPTPTANVPGTLVDIFWNVNTKGYASGSPVLTRSVNGTPLELFSGSGQTLPKWLLDVWLIAHWLTELVTPSLEFNTPLVYFGLVRVLGVARDLLGNPQADGGLETTIVVNSNPTAPSNFRRDTFSGGQQFFLFNQSVQLEL